MNRREFIKLSTVAGMATPFMSSLLSSCQGQEVAFFPKFEVNFSGKVLIIGAGTAGLIAGHVLKQYNIDFEILEASSVYGGRVKAIDNFADFPIDLGAEWLHTSPAILAKLLNDPSNNENIDIINYTPETIYIWGNGKLKKRNFYANFYGEYKFKSTTWYSFFERYIAPQIVNQISFNSPVNSIDYSTNQVTVTNTLGQTFTADRVILTVPLTILKKGLISFQPSLPSAKVNALDMVTMPDGIKVFIEFSEKFYPDLLAFDHVRNLLDSSNGEKLYYNAAFRKNVSKNILGLFTVGEPASVYTNQPDEASLLKFILAELDEIFKGKASQFYKKHIIQNWTKEPYIQGSYSHYQDISFRDVLAQSIENKVYFAGEAYASGDVSTVHGAGESAYQVVEQLLKNSG